MESLKVRSGDVVTNCTFNDIHGPAIVVDPMVATEAWGVWARIKAAWRIIRGKPAVAGILIMNNYFQMDNDKDAIAIGP